MAIPVTEDGKVCCVGGGLSVRAIRRTLDALALNALTAPSQAGGGGLAHRLEFIGALEGVHEAPRVAAVEGRVVHPRGRGPGDRTGNRSWHANGRGDRCAKVGPIDAITYLHTYAQSCR